MTSRTRSKGNDEVDAARGWASEPGVRRRLAAAEQSVRALRGRLRQLRAENAALRLRGEHDALTGLLNRGGAEAALAREVAHARRHGHELSVGLLDLDEFELINDARGRLEGDRVLRRVGAVLEETARARGLVGRWGGDEFLIALPRTAARAAVEVMERVRTTLAEAPRPAGRITATFGIATLAPDPAGVRDLLLAADAALREAKRGERHGTSAPRRLAASRVGGRRA